MATQVIEDGFERGLRQISLGEGGQDYKYRFADSEERLALERPAAARPRLGLVSPTCRPAGLRRAAGRRTRARADRPAAAPAALPTPGPGTADLEHEVEWRLGRLAEARVPALPHDRAQPLGSCLGAEREADLLTTVTPACRSSVEAL